MLDRLMHDFLVATERKVVVLLGDVGFGNAKALSGPEAFALYGVALAPAGQDVGEVVLGVLLFAERSSEDGAEFLVAEERHALVVETPTVGVDVVEPDCVGAAGVRFREEQNR